MPGRNFMPSRYASHSIAAESERARLARPVRLQPPKAPRPDRSGEEYTAQRLVEGLGQMRIAGRHAEGPLDAAALDRHFKETGVPAEQLQAAYAAGQRDRANGVRCMCVRCEGQAATAAERQRWGTEQWKGEPNIDR
jgi:hypothetical protein